MWHRSVVLAMLAGLSISLPASYMMMPVMQVEAASQEVDADGVYTLGDGLDESIGAAKVRARQEALRMAAEQAGTYVESYTKTVNHELSEDEVSTLASTVLRVMEETYTTDDMGGQGVRICCHIRAVVDSVTIDKALDQRQQNNRKWEAMVQQNKRLQEDLSNIQKEYETLKADYQDAKDAQEKNVLDKKLKKNEEKVTAADLVNRAYQEGLDGKFPEAIVDCNHAIEISPDYAYAYTIRGSAYGALGQFSEALKDCNRALEMDSEDAYAYTTRGSVYLSLKQYEKALSDYSKALDIHPDNYLIYWNRGREYALLGKYDKALEDYNRADKLSPDNSGILSDRGTVYIGLKENDEAMLDLNRAIALNPKNAFAYANRALISLSLAQYKNALSDFSKAIAIQPDMAEAYYYRGAAYEALGQKKEARADREQAQRLNPALK